MEKDPSNSSIFNGYQNGYLLEVVLEKDRSKVSQVVAIMDTKTNASKTYDQLNAQYAPLVQIQYPNVSVTANSVAVGDQGKMYVFKGISPQKMDLYYLIFTRGNVFEIIIMQGQALSSSDEKVIIDIARNADRRITIQPVPMSSSTPNPNFKTLQTPAHTLIPTTIPTPIPTVRPPSPIGNTIAIKNFAFDPSALTVKSGTAVMWTNLDAAPHAIVFDIGSPVTYSSGSLPPGSSYSLTFTQPGTYMYHCSIHPSMKGTIVVQN
jgi:hypothetical protein